MIKKFQRLEVRGRKSSKPWKFFAVLFPMLGSLAFAQGPGGPTFFQAWYGAKLVGWTPAKIPSLDLWLDAADLSTLWADTNATTSVTNNGTVARWDDKSGNSRNATQATSANQPTYNNGVLSFDGSDDNLIFSGSTSTNYALKYGTNGFSIAAVVFPFVANRTPQVFFGARRFGSGWFFGLNSANTFFRMFFLTANREQWLPSPQSTTSISTNLHILIANGQRGSTGTIYRTGNLIASSSSVVNSDDISQNNTSTVRVGAYENDSGVAISFWFGQINEIILVKGLFSQSDREKTEGYLAHKWGLTASLPADHPYKNAPP